MRFGVIRLVGLNRPAIKYWVLADRQAGASLMRSSTSNNHRQRGEQRASRANDGMAAVWLVLGLVSATASAWAVPRMASKYAISAGSRGWIGKSSTPLGFVIARSAS